MRKTLRFAPLLLLTFSSLLFSCGSYRQNIMFQSPEGAAMQKVIDNTEGNYIIQKNDLLLLDVYTNLGERIIDPDLKLIRESTTQNIQNIRPKVNYLVDAEGNVKLPMVGVMKLEGLTLRQAEEILQKEYNKFYQDSFVTLRYENKRVIVLGSPGGQVIPLVNENITLVEVLALAKGVGNDAKVGNIRVIRGQQVFMVDLSTIDGYTKSNMLMAPGDVIYVEPVRRPLAESIRDYGPVVSIITSVATLIIVAIGL